jgi:hypothetical protein
MESMTADRHSLHVAQATEAVLFGPAPPLHIGFFRHALI